MGDQGGGDVALVGLGAHEQAVAGFGERGQFDEATG
jgi:hypothetical protein